MKLKEIKSLRKKIEKDWGKKCKDFCIKCVVCQIGLALDILEENYEYVSPQRINKKQKKLN